MSDSYEHEKPYSLTAIYQETPQQSTLTAPYDLHATYDAGVAVDANINTAFNSDINAEYTESSNEVNTTLNTSFNSNIVATFNINHIVGLHLGLSAGTGGNVTYEAVNNPLFTSETVAASYAKSRLAKAGLIESHSFNMPLTNEIGQCKPSDILAFNADWWGVVDSVSVSFTYAKVVQTVSVERVNHG